jgi:hypothetical protein
VVFVVVGRDEDNGKEVELTARTGDVYKQTSYNTYSGVHLLNGIPFRKNYAGVGYKYDSQRDAFIPPQPFPSWVMSEDTCQWSAPISMPTDGDYFWDEPTTSWVMTSA